ncbi:hypothetical protein PM082_022697 [Marasmius tenuissimus]|nr:hypothetical protein PM082_022697 [Marasmius tenuissimus]
MASSMQVDHYVETDAELGVGTEDDENRPDDGHLGISTPIDAAAMNNEPDSAGAISMEDPANCQHSSETAIPLGLRSTLED